MGSEKEELLPLIPPGEILLEEFMIPNSLSMNQLSRDIEVPAGRISQIISGRRAISADTALRLARYFGTSAEMWLGLQKTYELNKAKREVGATIDVAVKPLVS